MTIPKTKILTTILFLLIGFACLAQGVSPPPPAGPVVPGLVPIDGGVLAGILVALGYGAKKLLFQKEKK
ncbi:hypothetical protein [Tamlana sp. I1]|uniref:hypothetical protein n=1 Tax=Tamlana sp. I1 TaxID=2762061 RepID=UPI00189069FE|nr:hypothetical protein [Tamlana sp. I1]